MIWTVACSACGHPVRLNPSLKDRVVCCPCCLSRFTPESPATFVQKNAPQSSLLVVVLARLAALPRLLNHRTAWLLCGLVGLTLFACGIGIGVARARWSMGPAPLSAESMGWPGDRPGVLGTRPAARWTGPLGPSLDLPKAAPLPLPPLSQETGALVVAGRLARTLAAEHDAASGSLIGSTLDDRLHVFAADSLRPRHTHQLERTAYRLVIDARRRLLYAALVPADHLRMTALGDSSNLYPHFPSELCVYDLHTVLQPPRADRRLLPLRRLEIDGHLLDLSLTCAGAYLVYRADNHRLVHVGRVDTSRWLRDRDLPVDRIGTSSLSVAADEPIAIILSGASVWTLDIPAWEVRDQVEVTGAVQCALAVGSERLLLVERRPALQFHLLERRNREIICRWQLDLDGRSTVVVHPGGKRMYVGTSAVTAGRIVAIDLPAGVGQPIGVGQVGNDGSRLIRGTLMMSGDGRVLLTGNGLVFRPVS